MATFRAADWDDLPAELVVQLIREGAATSKQFAVVLCTVSSWTRQLALPFLFTSVILDEAERARSFQAHIASAPFLPPAPTFHHQNLVRSIWLSSSLHRQIRLPDDSLLEDIARSCPNLEHLAARDRTLLSLFRAESSVVQGTHDLRLTVLFSQGAWLRISILAQLEGAARSLLFDRVTHLRFVNSPSTALVSLDGSFPRLTHFAMPWHQWYTIEPDIWTHPRSKDYPHAKRLEMFVFLVDTTALTQHEKWFCDIMGREKNIYVAVSRHENWEDEWRAEGLRGGESLWQRASKDTALWKSNRLSLLK